MNLFIFVKHFAFGESEVVLSEFIVYYFIIAVIDVLYLLQSVDVYHYIIYIYIDI